MGIKKRQKVVKVVWIIVTIIIAFTMILFSSGGHLLSSGSVSNYDNAPTHNGY